MTNEQILKKAIEKAVKNGWKVRDSWLSGARENIDNVIVELVIFNHNFAKAFFGERLMEIDVSTETTLRLRKVPEWQDCLQQMVLIVSAKDKLKYIEKFL